MKKIPKAAVIFIYLFILLIVPSLSSGDSAKYFYDDLGRLTRVVKGTTGTIYNYDDLGNLVSVTSATTTASSPTLTSVAPNVLFVGSTSLVTIYGQNLLTTESVTANGGLVAIDDVVIVSDTQITAEMTAFSAGTDTIKVTTQNGTPNYATVGVALSSSQLTFSPGQVALTPGASGSITANISPPLSDSLTVNLNSSSPSIATAPPSVTIPASGTVTFTVNAIRKGISTISSGDPNSVVFVTDPFSPGPGEEVFKTAKPVSVYVEPKTLIRSSQASAYIEQNSMAVSRPVSAYVSEPSMVQSSQVGAYVERDTLVVSGLVSVKVNP